MRDPGTVIGELLLGRDESAMLRKRLMVGLSGLLSLRVAFGGISFVLTILLARTLGDQGFGTYSYALAWVMLLGAPAVLGMDQLLVREVAAYVVKSEWGLLRGVVRLANRAVLLVSFGLVLAAVAGSWLLRARATGGLLPTFWVALILVPLIALTRVRQATVQGLHRVVLASIPERLVLPSMFLALLFTAGVAHVKVTPTGAMGLNGVATALAFAVGVWLLHRAFPAEARRVTPVYRTAAWARSAFPILLFGGAGIVFAQADILILGWFKGAGVVGLYGVADKSADLLTFVMVAQNAAFASTAASLHAERDLASLQRLATRIARLTLLATLPLAIVFIGFGHWFLTRFYGAGFAHAQPALAILSVGQLLNVGTGLNGMLLLMTGHERDMVKVVAASAATNIALNVILAPKWGTEGAALANTASLLLLNLLATATLHRRTGIHSTVLGVLSVKRGFR